MSDAQKRLYTIGHSDHAIETFISLLLHHGVSAIADVRSQPYSRLHGQFNREILKDLLKRAGIRYVFLGHELGARRSERESYREGQARYDLIAQLPAFQDGLDRLRRGLITHRIALLCSERDPITCHRMVLVCRHLRPDPITILHILEDGSTETMDQAETRLLESVRLPTDHLFRPRSELIEHAYDLQGGRIAYREPDAAPAANGVNA